MPVTVLSEKRRVDEVSQIDVTEEEQLEDGTWLREIRVWGEPPAEGATKPLVMTIVVVSDDQQKIQVRTPELAF